MKIDILGRKIRRRGQRAPGDALPRYEMGMQEVPERANKKSLTSQTQVDTSLSRDKVTSQ
ncbi:MAG: hypothetical protein WD688_17050 [Candidatus Binatia bacterium]